MPAPVEETDIDLQCKKFTSVQRQEQHGVLTNMLHYNGIMRFPEDEFDSQEDKDNITKEKKVTKRNDMVPAIHPLSHHLG
jgi:hypothetical protein